MLVRAAQYIIPYSDLVEMFYISLCNRFINPNSPTVAILGYSEIEFLVKECFSGILYEVAGNSSVVANLDDTLFLSMREKLKHVLMFHGFGAHAKHIYWWDNFIEEILFPKIMERVQTLRNLGPAKARIDWRFDQGCVLVSL